MSYRNFYSAGIYFFICNFAVACSLSDDSISVHLSDTDPTGQELVLFSNRTEAPIIRHARSRHDFDRHTDIISGFSTPEHSPNGEIDFAWAIEQKVEVKLTILDSESTWLHFSARPFILNDNRQQVTSVRLNEIDLGSVVLEGNTFSVHSLSIPNNVLHIGDNTIELEFSYAESPEKLRLSSDTRTLAAAFDYIAITTHDEPADSMVIDTSVTNVPLSLKADKIVLPSDTEIIFPLKVPSDGILTFSLEHLTEVTDSNIRGEISLRTLDLSEEVFFRNDSTGGPWHADLSTWAGEHASLVFRAVGGMQNEQIEWLTPKLYGNTGETNISTNIVFIVIDTLRADYLSSYGGPVNTPNIDRLANSGIRFERAYSHIPITVPSHSSMFTSLLPTEHGALNNGNILSEAHVTLAELLRDSYRKTAGFVSLGVLKNRFGVAQGFNHYEDTFPADWWKTAEEMNQLIVPWIIDNQMEPYFLFAHYSDPHEPYASPLREHLAVSVSRDTESLAEIITNGSSNLINVEIPIGISTLRLTPKETNTQKDVRLKLTALDKEITVSCSHGCKQISPDGPSIDYDTRLPATLTINNPREHIESGRILIQARERLSVEQVRERYREEVEYVDAAIGTLLDTITSSGKQNNTIVMLTSDHGEGLGDHELIGHVSHLYEEALRVPLIISWPGQLDENVVIHEPVSHIDILPTLVELLDLEDSQRRSGKSLAPLLRDPAHARDNTGIIAETFRPESVRDRRTLIKDGFKLIVTPRDSHTELYDLQNDQREMTNIASDDTETTSGLDKLLAQRMTRAQSIATATEEQALTDEEIERLRSLGYVR
tara:strand:+ start:2894 stop:5374 length:2481 start_codon:yes stop_codon:yes gene_type:complete